MYELRAVGLTYLSSLAHDSWRPIPYSSSLSIFIPIPSSLHCIASQHLTLDIAVCLRSLLCCCCCPGLPYSVLAVTLPYRLAHLYRAPPSPPPKLCSTSPAALEIWFSSPTTANDRPGLLAFVLQSFLPTTSLHDHPSSTHPFAQLGELLPSVACTKASLSTKTSSVSNHGRTRPRSCSPEGPDWYVSAYYSLFQLHYGRPLHRFTRFISTSSDKHSGMTGSYHITGLSLNPNKPIEGSPTVRFASANEEIEPVPLDHNESIPPRSQQEELSIKELSQSLQSTQLQGRRMSHFAFEPVSLPASRVCSDFLIHTCFCPNIRYGRSPSTE